MPSLNVNRYDMSSVERGAGEPLVFVHGSLNDHRNSMRSL